MRVARMRTAERPLAGELVSNKDLNAQASGTRLLLSQAEGIVKRHPMYLLE